MRHRWAGLIAVLALGPVAFRSASAQGLPTSVALPPDVGPGVVLGQNYPNPINPTTTIPFTIGDSPICADSSRSYRVTLRIFNVLAQLVAIPILQGAGATAGQPLLNVLLRCGSYTAYWNGNFLNTSQEVASGIYLYRIEVDGKSMVRKMIVMK